MDVTLKEDMLARWHKMVERDREILAIWKEKDFRFRTNGEDTTAEDMADWQRRIDQLQGLIDRVEASDA